MHNSTPESARFNWKLPACTALGVVAVYVLSALWGENAIAFVYVLLLRPGLILASIGLIVYGIIGKRRRKWLAVLTAVAVLWATGYAVFMLPVEYDLAIRTTARWLIWSNDYKAKVLAEPASTNGSLKHIEWESWGIVPSGFTVVYLVFDPSDLLSAAARKRQPGKFDGIPCEVPEVNRLEKNWYTVMFYTDDEWSHCQ